MRPSNTVTPAALRLALISVTTVHLQINNLISYQYSHDPIIDHSEQPKALIRY